LSQINSTLSSETKDKIRKKDEGRRKQKHTSEGGFNPHFFALSHLCNLEIPTEGPYLEVISNTLRISIYQLLYPWTGMV
jgi:hypothetical protein